MAESYKTTDLVAWDTRISQLATSLGLDYYPQDFMLCDEEDMLSFMAYGGMPSHYPHWSYGKSYERTRMGYEYGVSGLPYELVINSDPCLAYLMADNSLLLQVLTIAHVYGHNDFFKNNATFAHTRAHDTVGRFKRHAECVRDYVQRYGVAVVEEVLDAAHSLRFNRSHDLYIKPDVPSEDEEAASGSQVHENLLLYLSEHAHALAPWQRDLLRMVDEEACYFIPQVQTKILNEGWASYWHYTMLHELELPEELHMEFLVRHNQVLRPSQGSLNPYHVGFTILRDIEARYGRAHLFEVRSLERDTSFLRRYLTEDLVRELELFQFQRKDTPFNSMYQVTEVADEQGWKVIRDSLIRNAGFGDTPRIVIVDDNYLNQGALRLEHDHDTRELETEYLTRTLMHVHTLWQRDVYFTGLFKKKQRTCRLLHKDRALFFTD